MRKMLKEIVVKILTKEARGALRRHAPKIIAVTGSVGKTSTKEAVADALEATIPITIGTFSVRKSQKSFNSDIGVPLAILGLSNAWGNPFGWMKNIVAGFFAARARNFPKILVLEVGADHPGDISSIAKWLPVDIIVFTRMAPVPVHVEFFGSPEKVLEEKISLIGALKKNGAIVVNALDEKFLAAAKNAGRKIVEYKDRDSAAIAVVSLLGYDTEKARKALEKQENSPGRMKIIKGIRGSMIIDDTYNSSPIATEAALRSLAAASERKIAVLGDMKELGHYSSRSHYDIGKIATKSADMIFSIGNMAKDFTRGAIDGGFPPAKIFEFNNSVEAGKKLLDIVRPGDVILIKGSQSMRMEKAVKMIMEEKYRSKELLVRQEKEWQNR